MARLVQQLKEALAAFCANNVSPALQGYVNDPSCMRDLGDIRALLRANLGLDMREIREYFVLFEREALLYELVADIGRH